MTKIGLPIKTHGGKGPLASKIVALMPPRCRNPNKPDILDKGWLHYCEPYFGGGAVLFANNPDGISEVINDLNGELTNFWRVLQNDKMFETFVREIQATPFSEREFDDATPKFDESEPIAWAINFFIRCRQSLAGRMKGFAGITRNRTRRGQNEQVSAWLNAIEGLPVVHERLKRVLIRNRPAVEIIKAEDGPRTLFYADPPYYHQTRASTDTYGEYEMSDADHEELLKLITNSDMQSKFLLSGYRNELYDKYLVNWSRIEFDVANNASGAETKRRMTECVWANFEVNIND